MPASKLKPSFSGDVGVLVSWEEVRPMVGDVNVVGAEGVEGRRPEGVLTRAGRMEMVPLKRAPVWGLTPILLLGLQIEQKLLRSDLERMVADKMPLRMPGQRVANWYLVGRTG
jgi:hypothetical protein